MSVLENLRQRSGLLVTIVGIALFTFVLTGVFESGLMGSTDTTVGEISGKTIDYNKFNPLVQNAIENRKQALGKTSLNEKEINEVVQEVWNRLVNEEIMFKEYEKLGISVSADELYYVMIENPHPYFVRYISDPNTGQVNPIFADPNTGQVSPKKLRDFTQAMSPEQEEQWVQLEEFMRQIRIMEKYNILVKKGMHITNSYAKRLFHDQNDSIDIEFAFKAFNAVLDNQVKYNDDDINKYYAAHKNEYKQDASRTIEYVVFDITPSEEDVSEVMTSMNKVAEEFKIEKAFSEDSLIVIVESDERSPSQFDYYTKGTLSPFIDSIMFAEKTGYVIGPYTEGNTVKVSKLTAIKRSADSAKVRHILISHTEAGLSQSVTRTKEQAKAMADSLMNALKSKKGKRAGESFVDLVEKYSDDGGKIRPQDKKEGEYYMGKGGDYGWLNATSSFVPEFKNAGLDGKKGDIVVVESQFGYHIVEILDSKGSQKKVQVLTVERKLQPSNKTMQSVFARASEFAGRNNTMDLFQQAIVEQKLSKRVAPKIKESDRLIPGIESSRAIIKWLYENKKGTVSEPKDVGGRFIVAVVSDIREKGIATLEQVKDDVTEAVIKEKKAALISGEFNEAKKGGASIEQIATNMSLYPGVAQGLTFRTNSIVGIGYEPAIVGAISVMKEKTLSSPIKGKTGVGVFYVTKFVGSNESDGYQNQKNEELFKLQMRVDYEEVFNALKESANVQDHLVKFY
jgi:peptidyl-prolyl cis-trans isomerase D